MVRSHLIYCSPVWRPRFIEDIQLLERVQRRATKYILNDFTSDYKDRLISLKLLPLMMFYELLDIMFFVKSLKTPNDCFDISNYLQFKTHNTRSSNIRLVHTRSSNNSSTHFYFNRLPRLWNALPPINLDLPIYLIKSQLKSFLWNRFYLILILIIIVLIIFCAPVTPVCVSLMLHYDFRLPICVGMPSVYTSYSLVINFLHSVFPVITDLCVL